MTRRQLAHYFRVEPTTIDRWARKGEIPFTYITKDNKKIRTYDVDKVLERLTL